MLVKDEFRKNELSHIPGGYALTSIMRNGRRLTYDKIKNIDAYSKRLMDDPEVVEIWHDGNMIWKRS